MEFRDLKTQYLKNKAAIDSAIQSVLSSGHFIGGDPVRQLEEKLADYVGVKHCITCANGTDALQLALMAWGIGEGDAIFVPDFTFFSTAEVVPWMNATPVFVDVERDTFNISTESLEKAIQKVVSEGKLVPRVVIAVDLFGQPADYPKLKEIVKKYDMLLLEDGAQGFGGRIGNQCACSFGDIATTSFFPAKPFGGYGDGGAVFTDNDEWAELIRSYKEHGKGKTKYDNERIGLNSRLDTIQAAILLAKFDGFVDKEIDLVNQVASCYSECLSEAVEVPVIKTGYLSSWAQYTIKLESEQIRDKLQRYLEENKIPSMVYYSKPLHKQRAFEKIYCCDTGVKVTENLCQTVLSLPIHPYIRSEIIKKVADIIKAYLIQRGNYNDHI